MDQPPEDQVTPEEQPHFRVDMTEYGPITQTFEGPTGVARLGTSITITGPFQLVQYVDGRILLFIELTNARIEGPGGGDLTRLLVMFGLSAETPEDWLKQHGRMGTFTVPSESGAAIQCDEMYLKSVERRFRESEGEL